MTNITYKNQQLILNQQAYVSGDGKTYQASASDKDGNNYLVVWDIVCDDTQGDESNACNWDKYTVVAL